MSFIRQAAHFRNHLPGIAAELAVGIVGAAMGIDGRPRRGLAWQKDAVAGTRMGEEEMSVPSGSETLRQ
jgi:hypothetical protein